MSRTKQTYSAPTLTYYGKLAELTQAGSTILFQGDISGDGANEQFWDVDNDGRVDVVAVPKSDSSGTNLFSVTLIGSDILGGFYDSDGDGTEELFMFDNDSNGADDAIDFDTSDLSIWSDRD